MIEKVKTAAWFLRRPTHWAQASELGLRKLRPNRDGALYAADARSWAQSRAVSISEALVSVGLSSPAVPELPASILAEAQSRADKSDVKMGGPGDIGLLYAVTRLSGARRVVETGVAYGWSSLAILAGLEGRDGARLISVDMPYPKMNNEAFVGIAVPDRLRRGWEIVREPDRHGLKKAISRLGSSIELCHYDSDKSYWGRQYGFRLMWDALLPGGIFISDDIQDNLAFKEFVEVQQAAFAVTEYQNKFVGVVRKNG